MSHIKRVLHVGNTTSKGALCGLKHKDSDCFETSES
jgi:hypothetical protein